MRAKVSDATAGAACHCAAKTASNSIGRGRSAARSESRVARTCQLGGHRAGQVANAERWRDPAGGLLMTGRRMGSTGGQAWRDGEDRAAIPCNPRRRAGVSGLQRSWPPGPGAAARIVPPPLATWHGDGGRGRVGEPSMARYLTCLRGLRAYPQALDPGGGPSGGCLPGQACFDGDRNAPSDIDPWNVGRGMARWAGAAAPSPRSPLRGSSRPRGEGRTRNRAMPPEGRRWDRAATPWNVTQRG